MNFSIKFQIKYMHNSQLITKYRKTIFPVQYGFANNATITFILCIIIKNNSDVFHKNKLYFLDSLFKYYHLHIPK